MQHNFAYGVGAPIVGVIPVHGLAINCHNLPQKSMVGLLNVGVCRSTISLLSTQTIMWGHGCQ